jgi:hypothetical protein
MITLDIAKRVRQMYRDNPNYRIEDVAQQIGADRTAVNDILTGFRLPAAVEPGDPKNLVQARREAKRKVGD